MAQGILRVEHVSSSATPASSPSSDGSPFPAR
jgi:hypothetical protein